MGNTRAVAETPTGPVYRPAEEQRVASVTEEDLGYRGELQLILDAGDGRERVTVRLDER
ncbi:hypothetical protein [Kitasatospora sp. NPDC090091]|uniref:hypothetical protein n=1 Tax=Kitasatospora sp. NPDC090091 TaxID=3364081 RepID=UPI003828D518